MIFPLVVFGQSRNNDEEVVKIERYAMRASVPNQLIVKFHDYSDIRVDATRGAKRFVSASKSTLRVNQVLEEYEISKIEQIVPNFVMPGTSRSSKSYGGEDVVEHDLSQIHLIVLSSNSAKNNFELIEALNTLEEVEFAEPNYICYTLGAPADYVAACDATAVDNTRRAPTDPVRNVLAPNDPMYGLQWGFMATGLDSLLMQPKLDSTASRKVIAIIDTGVDPDHPDLSGNLWTNPAEQNDAAGQDDDNNGFADDIHGWDFVNQTGQIRDNNSHGTHCAGIAAAVGNNGIGITGANPDALIMPVTVLQSDGSGSIATIIQGVNYAVQNGADVISMSLGLYTHSAALEQCLANAYQSCLIVAAAGNDGMRIDSRCGDINDKPMFPAAYSFVIGVQATSSNNGLASFSNWDCDGPSYSQFGEDKLYNYEISAPGVSITSTVPNGQYRSYNGTSMACPLVAGGLSALMERRHYANKEVLFGDMINTSEEFRHINFFNIYQLGENPPARFQCVDIEINDTVYGDGSMTADVGERIQIYPTIRSVWGQADSISVWMEFREFEDTTVMQFVSNHVDFGHPLSSYGKNRSANPIEAIVANGLADGRHISLNLCVASPNCADTLIFPYVISVTNGVKLGGMIIGNDTLWPNVHYIVTRDIAIAPNASLTIMPGTTLKFQDGTSLGCSGKLKAIGTPDSMITFTIADYGSQWKGLTLNHHDTLSYCIIEQIVCGVGVKSFISSSSEQLFRWEHWFENEYEAYFNRAVLDNCMVRYNDGTFDGLIDAPCYSNSTLMDNVFFGDVSPFTHTFTSLQSNKKLGESTITNNNIVNNDAGISSVPLSMHYGTFSIRPTKNNIFNNYTTYNFSIILDEFHVSNLGIGDEGQVWNDTISGQLYFGSAREDLVRPSIFDFENELSGSMGRLDLSNMSTRPVQEAHGVVWKVEVQGFDCQDQFDSIMPLGPGTHEFKVYFNRAMDTSVTPMLAMGVRSPYTQTAIAENSYWSADSTIWSASITLTGRESIDGINRIYVWKAKDNEHFDIPLENLRFHVPVSSSGALSMGFQATPQIGRIELEWNDQEVNYDDFLGFNMYRFRYDSVETNLHYNYDTDEWVYDTIWTEVDTVLLNTSLIQDTTFVDYAVEPGVRYYYYYKILSTSLTENDPSKVVSAVPFFAIRGDANGSAVVDIADVICVINYITFQNPLPFMFESADVNGDGVVDLLDVVGIINIILYGDQGRSYADPQTARYTIENEILYVESPVALGGIQVTLEDCTISDIEVLEALHGFELVNAPVGGNDLLLMAYSMSGMQIPAGKHALLRIGDKQLDNIVLSDPEGHNVMAVHGGEVGVPENGPVSAQIMRVYPNPFEREVNIVLDLGETPNHSAQLIITDILGRQVCVKEIGGTNIGQYSYRWNVTGMGKGVYFVTLSINGVRSQTKKIILK
ncbi:MAG: S8 family serine peptidase [Paludibacteraceae bacterium]|nr:S8 family serine peptidase [Paludibacteraceae bacterium]